MSPLRALLTAQAQSTWNRLRREGGEASFVAAGLVAALAVAAMTPPAWGCFASGRAFGRGLASGDSLAAGVTGFQALILFVGVVAGLVEHRLLYSADGFRLFPVPRMQWLAAELLAGLLNLLTLLGVICCTAFAAGLSLGAPAGAPAFLLIGLQAVLWLALIQHVVALAKRAAAGRPYWAAAALIAVAGLLSLAAPGAGLDLREAIHATMGKLNAVMQLLPFSTAYRGALDLVRGRFGAGLLRQLVMLASTALFVGVVAWIHFRSSAVLAAAGRSPRRERVRHYRGPVEAMAHTFRALVLGTREGRLLLLIPLVFSLSVMVTDVAVREMQGRAESVPWSLGWLSGWNDLPLLGILLTFLPTLSDVWLNQFGWDGPAIRSLFLLPLTARQILLGRLLGLLQLLAPQLVLAIAPLLFRYRPAVTEVIWGLAAAGTVFLVLTGVGHLVSARFPRSLRAGVLISPTATPMTAFVIPTLVQLPVLCVVLLTYKAFALLGPWGPPLGMSLLLAATATGYWYALPFISERVMTMREILVEELA